MLVSKYFILKNVFICYLSCIQFLPGSLEFLVIQYSATNVCGDWRIVWNTLGKVLSLHPLSSVFQENNHVVDTAMLSSFNQLIAAEVRSLFC